METENIDSKATGTKRTAANTLMLDPDTGKEISNPKTPTLDLNKDKKQKVLKSIISGYKALMTALKLTAHGHNITLSNLLASIMSTIHNVERAKANGKNLTAADLAKTSRYTVTVQGGTHSLGFDAAHTIWKKVLKDNELEYKAYSADDRENWVGTMSPYLCFFWCIWIKTQRIETGSFSHANGKSEWTSNMFSS